MVITLLQVYTELAACSTASFQQNTQTSSKFKDIILKCDEIQKESPARYRLITKTDNIGTLRRVTFGEKNPNKVNKTILLVGETGAEKSTLINTLLNYSMGVKFEDDIWFQIVEEEKRSQSESQTSDVIVYEIFDFKGKTLPYSLTIIDTPGYGHTKEVGRDVIVTQRLFDLFRSKKGVHEIDAVGLVVKASECRLSDDRTRSMRGMSQFTEFLGKLGPQKLQETLEVLRERIRLTACIQNLQDRINLIELKHREIEQTQSALKKYEQQMKLNKEFTLEEAYEHVDRLNQIALNVDSLSTYVHYDFLIEKMKEKGDTEKVQKLEEKTHRLDEMIRTGAQYTYERICKIFKGNKNNRSNTEV
ncbi:uncharacterized protein LOC108874601 [Lates calcarifer]|uniref:Uncharacterized protein LOC108874601 n=1 Tax=Lates calcarifer TaxID=8187 RepID=A0AAJ8B3X8_LATCA|nr:uncharacterized protein LOC108874601 [Lates calcarifer]